MDKQVIKDRIAALRGKMAEAGLAAVIIPQSDPHLSEYLASHWQVRRWFSGFTGSAGDLVVTPDKAYLWTDSRYFLQAGEQLDSTGIELMKDGLAETPSIQDFLAKTLPQGSKVGVDGMLFSVPKMADLRKSLAKHDISVVDDFEPAEGLWLDRPALPDSKIFIHDVKYAGVCASDKITDILGKVVDEGADATLISALDEIAWTLNIRCDDVKHTPVATAYLYLGNGGNVLLIDPAKLTDETVAYLKEQGVETAPYDSIKSFLAAVPAERVLINPALTSATVRNILGDKAYHVGIHPAAFFKAAKNEVQLQGVRNAMVRDGVALVKAFMEIEKRLADGVHTTEMDVAEILRQQRSASPMFFDESFGTIAGYGPHGAIVHYEADEHSNSTLEPHGLLLIDSGAQYLDGTTDITRTIALGTPTPEEKLHFTLVMKGHIALGTAIFPDDTRGAQLDALARQFLWKHGMSYLHGTGHGVGHFLGVHEGPQSIRLNFVDTILRPGMITSNEPGVYCTGLHGIRCENLVLTVPKFETDFGKFLCFETLTMFPFDNSLMDTEILSDDEIDWYNHYQATVRERLLPHLTDEAEKNWLISKTQPIHK